MNRKIRKLFTGFFPKRLHFDEFIWYKLVNNKIVKDKLNINDVKQLWEREIANGEETTVLLPCLFLAGKPSVIKELKFMQDMIDPSKMTSLINPNRRYHFGVKSTDLDFNIVYEFEDKIPLGPVSYYDAFDIRQLFIVCGDLDDDKLDIPKPYCYASSEDGKFKFRPITMRIYLRRIKTLMEHGFLVYDYRFTEFYDIF